MLTFLALLVSMQCLHQRHALGPRLRMLPGAAGVAGMALAAACSVQAHGAERGAAAWFVSLLAAGMLTPFLGAGLRAGWQALNPPGRQVPAPRK